MNFARVLFSSLVGRIRSITRRVLRGDVRVGETRAYILAFTLAVATVGVFLGYHIASSYRAEMAYWQARQSSVAEDRAQRVSGWLNERQADAELFSTRPSVRAALQAYHDSGRAAGRPTGGPPSLTPVLDEMARLYGYAGVYVLDRDAQVVARSSRAITLSPALAEACRTAARAGAIRTDLLGDAPDKTLISFSVPVFPEPGTTEAGPSPGQPLGVALAVFDAAHTLFPLVTREGVPTQTAETVLVRREGNEIVYFSPLRRVPAGSLNFRFSLPAAPLPARAAVEGRETFVESTDYRGVPVLASTQHIPLTGWGLVRKIDRTEALEEFRRMAFVEVLAAGLLLLFLGGILLFHRRHVLTRVLKQEGEKFRSLLESAPDSMVVANSEGRILLANHQTEQQFGYVREELLGRPIEILVAERSRPEYRERFHRYYANLPYQHSGPCMVSLGLRKDGSEFPIEVLMTPLESPQGIFLISAIRDITERKRAEDELRRLNRALKTISACNQGLVRAKEESALLREVCGILVRVGGYRMAWVGYVEQDEAKSVRPVAQAGYDEGYVARTSITWADSERGRGPTGTAIRSAQPCVARNIATEPAFTPWRAEATRRGYASAIALPLIIQNQPLGALTIYAQEPEAFDEEQVKLLTELAADLSFGIRALHTLDEHARAEEATRSSEAQYRRLFETAEDGILILDAATGKITDVNPFLTGLLGYSREAFLGKELWEIGPFKDIEACHLAFRELQEKGRIRYEDLPLETTDGRSIAVEFVSNAYYVNERKVIKCNIRDITERKRAEEALVKLRHAVDASGEVVFMTDRDGIITFTNPEFTRLYGYAAEEVVGKVTPRILKSGNMRPEEYVDFWRTILEKRVTKGEIINRTKDGRLVTVESSANPILDEHGNITGFLAIQRDVTARKQLEEQFRQAQKMEAVGRLAGGIAHDFNNLLTIITGYGQLLLEELPEKNPLRLQVAEVLKAGERATSLTRQLLAFGRRQVLAPQVLDLNKVVVNTEVMLRRLIGEDIELVTIPGQGLGPVKADPGQIEQVILNLAVNARDAMPDGGKLTIETSNMVLDEQYACMHVSVQPGSYVMLAVSDTGCGMDAETQAHMFEPFFTTKEKGKGTGLGLATVYGIVKQSGGYIWVYSEVGKGTTFKIYLPRIHEPVEATELAPAESASAGGSEAILLVEDDSSVRSLVRSVLESRGYSLLVAHNGEEALELCKQHQGPIHLLLTDVVMPGISGRELAERVTPFQREMKVLYMSGYTDNAIVHHGVLDADVAFLQKPFSPQTLANKVRSVLDEEK